MAIRLRMLAASAAAALVAPLLPFAAAPAFAVPPEPPQPQSVTDFCQLPADFQPFTDIRGNTFELEIECLFAARITEGGPGELPETQYGPGRPVTRDAMASFVARLIDTANRLDAGNNIRDLPAFDGEVDFTDVAPNSVHAPNIDRLAEAEIVTGGPGGLPTDRYGPERPVTRAQMATFIRNALSYMTGVEVNSNNDYFTDDETAIPHEPRINAIASLGIAVGDGRDRYNPIATVTRQQMSGFLIRTLAVLEAADEIEPLTLEDAEQERPSTAVTDAPDLVSADLLRRTSTGTATSSTTTVRFTFDEALDAASIDDSAFFLYTEDGEQIAPETGLPLVGGGSSNARLTASGSSSVLVDFEITASEAAEVRLATVDAGAVTDNEDNPNPIGAAPIEGELTREDGVTELPELLEVFRDSATTSSVTLSFVFDEEVSEVDGALFFAVSESGEQTPLESCEIVEGTGSGSTATQSNVVECTLEDEDDVLTLTVDESETFTAAEEAVVGTVDDGAVTDQDDDTNPEGAALVEEA